MMTTKIIRWRRTAALYAAFATFVVLPVQAQEKAGKAGKKAKGGAIKQAEGIAGKPLSPAQKAAIKRANATRKTQIAQAEARFDATVAKVLGLSSAQYASKRKALSGTSKP